MKKFFPFFILLILGFSIAIAADYDITITPSERRITMDQTAQFTATVTSNSSKTEKFTITLSPAEVQWSMLSEIIIVAPGSQQSADFMITPTKSIIPGPYGVKTNFRRESPEELIEKTVFINVQTASEIISKYKPSLKADVDMPVSITPDKRLTIRVNVENQNVLNLTDLKIKISGDLETLNTERTIRLAPLEEKVVDFTYELNPLQDPGDYRVSFELLKGNETIETFSTRILTVLEIKPGFAKEEKEKLGFLKLSKELTYTSKSNVKDTQAIKLPVSLIEKWFTSSIPKAKYFKEAEERFIGWDLELAPGESKTIFITVSYRPIFYIIALIVAAIVLYVFYKSPVNIKKEVSEVNLKEGGISQIRVMLEVKNSSKKSVSNVSIIDYVPNIADVEKTYIEGTLKPSKTLQHKERGTILKWELPELAPGEERLVSYNVRSKLSILGNFKLPRAKVKFKHRKKEHVSYSNTIGISA
ncbi:hypothetical protein KY331_00085 [Candidatus Woesearchaeota archaeon]|nr:hypothetical protein [Candidatus Woesearchaeota archaeon]